MALNVQLAPAPSVDDEQLSLIIAKSPGFIPLIVTLLTVTVFELLLVAVNVSPPLVLPTSTSPKKKLGGEIVRGGGSNACVIDVPKCGSGVPAYSAIIQKLAPPGSREIPL